MTQNPETQITIHTHALFASREIGDITCWAWIIAGSEDEPFARDGGYHPDSGFSRHKTGAKIEVISHALQWAAENGYQNVTVLTDSIQVVEQVNGIGDAPESVNDAYTEALRGAREALAQVGGLVAWIPTERNAAHEECKDLSRKLFEVSLDGKEKVEEFLASFGQEAPEEPEMETSAFGPFPKT